MALSRIINDFVSEEVDLEVTMRKLHVLLVSLKNDDLIKWVRNELTGYKKIEDLPQYRILTGRIVGSYTIQKNNQIITNKDTNLPTSHFKSDIIKNICTMRIKHSINELEEAIEQDGFCYPFPPEYYKYFSTETYMEVHSARVECAKTQVINIISNIKTKVTDVLLTLEQQFGKLDDLNININLKEKRKVKKIAQDIYIIIFQDNSIKIGNKNKFKNSKFLTNRRG